MKKRKYAPVLKGLLLLVNLAAIGVLTAGIMLGAKGKYDWGTWRNILEGKSYLESEEYQQEAASAVYEVMAVVSRASRLEKDGAYDPDRIVRLRDYLDSRTVYDTMPESEKGNGLCYRLGDLYQWSLKGTTVKNDVLWESYKPLFFGSIQEYAQNWDEEYNSLLSQLSETMKLVQSDVVMYQKDQKAWSYEATNIRYALWDMGNGNLCTNVPDLQKQDVTEDELKSYFKGFQSYYIFDSRSTSVEQQNVGDYYSYNTHALLTEWNAHLTGEYQVYVSVDTAFLVADHMAVAAQAYEEAYESLSPYVLPMAGSVVILFLSACWLVFRLARLMHRGVSLALDYAGVVARIILYFGVYELAQLLIIRLLGESMPAVLLLFLLKAAVLLCLIAEGIQRRKLLEAVQSMGDGEQITKISGDHLFLDNRKLAEAVNDLGDGLEQALKEQVKSERMKADLITNVSHDLKTPLTSIINYVDLMKKERIDNPRAEKYLEILDQKSQRLKQLTEDLVEASRASSGNVTLDMKRLDFKELLMQTSGEFEERFDVRGLKLMMKLPDHPVYVEADGRRLWRVIENLYRNVEKYAMPYTRVYLDVDCDQETVTMSMKNISEQPLNISAEELTERFTRGDESRTTEGSGLGLSIAKDLTELQHGTFDIYLDGDLFKVVITFPCISEEEAI